MSENGDMSYPQLAGEEFRPPTDTQVIVVMRGVNPFQVQALLQAILGNVGLCPHPDRRSLTMEALGYNDTLTEDEGAVIESPLVYEAGRELIRAIERRDLVKQSLANRPPLPE